MKKGIKTKEIALMAMFTAVTAILSQISINVNFKFSFFSIPPKANLSAVAVENITGNSITKSAPHNKACFILVSFGIMAVYFAGIFLLPKEAFWTQIGYVFLGAVGMPVYSGFKGGIGILFGPTGGFLMAYPFVAWLVSFFMNGFEKKKKAKKIEQIKEISKLFLAMVLVQSLLYFSGTLWFSFTAGTTLNQALVLTVYPFVVMDIMKIAFVIIGGIPLKNRLSKMKLLSF